MDHITFQKVLKREFTILTYRKNGLDHICCHKGNGENHSLAVFAKYLFCRDENVSQNEAAVEAICSLC